MTDRQLSAWTDGRDLAMQVGPSLDLTDPHADLFAHIRPRDRSNLAFMEGFGYGLATEFGLTEVKNGSRVCEGFVIGVQTAQMEKAIMAVE